MVNDVDTNGRASFGEELLVPVLTASVMGLSGPAFLYPVQYGPEFLRKLMSITAHMLRLHQGQSGITHVGLHYIEGGVGACVTRVDLKSLKGNYLRKINVTRTG